MNTQSKVLTIIGVLVIAAAAFFLVRSMQPKTPVTTDNGEVAGAGTGGCYVSGCSGQVCSDQKDVVTTCEFREEYACYKQAKCERQLSGQCGWTETTDFNLCVNAVLYPGSDLK